jgi:hypothetical protein
MSRDYEEFIAALNAHGVRYLLIGAHAVAYHARPRATKDLDILLDPTPENARSALAAMKEFFGGADLGYTVKDLTDPRWIIQLGVAPIRIDLHLEVEGSTGFDVAWKNRIEGSFGPVPAHYVGLDDLIRLKETAGRLQDRADIRILRLAKAGGKPGRRSTRGTGRRRE